jgi:ABC-type transport system substrate-binding protein
MKRNRKASGAAGPLLVALLATAPASAQKAGGILKMYTVDSPASMSILEEATVFAERPMMGVFNNLVIYDQHVKQNSLQSIVPDLATSWSWSEDGTELTFPLRQGVTWHDGKPFTANDVVCTWDLLTGKSNEKLRVNPASHGTGTSRRSPRMATTKSLFISSGRNQLLLRLLLLGIRRSTPVMFRRATCGSIRSAPAHSNSAHSSPTNILK